MKRSDKKRVYHIFALGFYTHRIEVVRDSYQKGFYTGRPKIAKQIGVPVASGSVFLDNDLSPKRMRYQMQRLLGVARHSGEGIGIGHPHRETLSFLRNYLPRLKSEVKVVRASEIAG